MKINRTLAAIASLSAVAATFTVPTAGAAVAPTDAPAADSIVVGPGSPIRMPEPDAVVDDGRHVKTGMCSTAVPGTVTDPEGNEHRVLITAGHCVNKEGHESLPKSSGVIYAPTHEGDVRIGTVGPASFYMPDPNDTEVTSSLLRTLDATFNGSDYAFIMLDDDVEATSISQSVDENGVSGGEGVQITGVVDYRELQPGEVSIDNLGRPICSDGSRSGRNCGVQIFRARNGVWAISYLNNGDSGGNAYDPTTNQAIGINSMAIGPVSRYQTTDQAIEDAYGIEDGTVNDHFQVEQSTAPQSEFRTIGEDMAADEAWIAENEPAEAESGSSIPEFELPDLPLPDLTAPVPAVPELAAPEIQVPNFADFASLR
ncbi:hypothetical protein [uncultured Corynebacterium sp.]|uniref:hypothetical protein n=1 Tax=uncultured Corynebacterium sp. TaxID=159447 RepID=UPI0025E4656B|nr:hypothetical protein [uncultured Corynebacterium sp.]